VADGIRHGVGFMNRGGYPKETIKYVGFYAGGACGKWDFYTDGTTTFCRNEDDFYKTRKPNFIECQKFLNMFGQFKNAFYKWFDDAIVNSVSA